MGDSDKKPRNIGWSRRLIRLPIRTWRICLPAYQDTISVRGFLKTLSLVGFGLAILLEAAALPYGDAADEFSDEELARSTKQIVASLRVSTAANARTAALEKEAAVLGKEAAVLRKEAEDERHARLEQGPRGVLLC
jgi:hypothetical protein